MSRGILRPRSRAGAISALTPLRSAGDGLFFFRQSAGNTLVVSRKAEAARCRQLRMCWSTLEGGLALPD
eukprot:4512291-Lingulodinium_polyedra.AAC.1